MGAWPTSAGIKQAKSETSDFAGHDADGTKPSPSYRALRPDVERVERVARRHEEAGALYAPRADVWARPSKRNRPPPFRFRLEHQTAPRPFLPSPPPPQRRRSCPHDP